MFKRNWRDDRGLRSDDADDVNEITRVFTITREEWLETQDGNVGSPCGACREYMMQLDRDSANIQILLDLETRKTVRLGELLPDWWGTYRFEQ